MEKSRALNASNQSVKQMIITPQKPRFMAERGWELGAKTPCRVDISLFICTGEALD